MAFTMYSYFNEVTEDLIISGQEETLDGYTQLDTPSTNPTWSSDWPWYSNRSSVKTVHIGSVSPIDVTSTAYMFQNCYNLTSLDLSSFDTSKVTDMNQMFYYCYNLTSLDLSNFDTSNVTSMRDMFNNCYNLTSLDLSSFDTSKVTSMFGMFNNCSKLTSLDLPSFDTSHVTSMSSMFSRCSKLSSLDLSSFDTSNVASMYSMFYGCSSLTSLDLSSFDTSKVTDMRNVFSGCSNLHIIDIPTTATNIVSQLPKDTYHDAETGTPYAKTDIPGGSTYVDDESYVTSPAGIIHTRQGVLTTSRMINDRISSLQNHRRILESEMSGDRMYVVSSADADQSVAGETVVAPCLLIVNGGGGTSMTYRR